MRKLSPHTDALRVPVPGGSLAMLCSNAALRRLQVYCRLVAYACQASAAQRCRNATASAGVLRRSVSSGLLRLVRLKCRHRFSLGLHSDVGVVFQHLPADMTRDGHEGRAQPAPTVVRRTGCLPSIA